MAKRNAECIFGILHMLQNIFRLVYGQGGSRRGNAWIVKTSDNFAQCARLDERVGVETADNLGARGGDAGVQRRVLPAVFLTDDTHLRMQSEALHGLWRRIGGTIVHKNDFQLLLRIFQCEQ